MKINRALSWIIFFRKKVFFYLAFLLLIGCGSSNTAPKVSISNTSKNPDWINNPNKDYPPTNYMTSVGQSKYKATAENLAKQNIVSIFSSNIQSEQNINQTTFETKDDFQQEFNQLFKINIQSNKEIENLKIAETYFDAANKKYYALAVIDKMETAGIYQQKIQEEIKKLNVIYNNTLIQNESLELLMSYSQMIDIFDKLDDYEQTYSILSGTRTKHRPPVQKQDLLVKRRNVILKMPIFITENRKFTKLQNNIQKVFNELGFPIVNSETDSYIVVNSNFNIKESDIKNKKNIFTKWNIDIKLKLKSSNNFIVNYVQTGRSGHISKNAAIEKGIYDMSQKISRNFKKSLINQLLNKKT